VTDDARGQEGLVQEGRGLRLLTSASPLLACVLLYFAGAAMLLAVGTPQLADRLRFVAQAAPLALIEVSHFTGSILATLMLFVAYGLSRRLAAARRAGIVLCLVSAALSLLRSFAWEEAAFLVLVACLLLATKTAYYRQSRLSSMRPGATWLTLVGAAIAVAAWAGFAAYERIPYSDDLWWRFLLDSDVSRFLRALTGVGLALAILLLWRFAGPARPPPAKSEDNHQARQILDAQARVRPEAWLAFTGDKTFLFSPTRRSMIMYAPHGEAWVAMGGPVGDPAERRDMVWQFREAADVANAWPAFYSVGPDLLPDLLDAGLALQKVGETALVELEAFSLEGPARAKLRQARARGQREGFTFNVEHTGDKPGLFRELQEISDAWMTERKGSEKGFSLGAFDEGYLSNFPIGVLRKDGSAVAFANVWPGGAGGDIAIDLMRNAPDASRAMEVLFVELIMWAKEQGYRRFDLGMAPLSGLEDRPFAPWLTRVGAMVYRHGGALYGFEGLREFKEKFSPVWEPRYLAAPDGWKLSAALGRVAFLTSGGIRGLFG
jgi:lysylphosphatidylglycerol synthetase-like protein (DUF2156 family)